MHPQGEPVDADERSWDDLDSHDKIRLTNMIHNHRSTSITEHSRVLPSSSFPYLSHSYPKHTRAASPGMSPLWISL